MSTHDDDERVTWQSKDPRNGKVVDYDGVSQIILERAYSNGDSEVVLSLMNNSFTVVFATMKQMNNSGGSRDVIRKSNKPPVVELPPVTLSKETVDAAWRAIDAADATVARLQEREGDRTSPLKTTDFGDAAPVVKVFDAILAAFSAAPIREKYGFRADADGRLLRLKFGDPTPGYYANVSNGQSIYHRKLLSILGLRNLVKYGPEIFIEMRERLFSGLISDYADKTGPHKMKYFTGNVVDLDTCVLRCHEKSTLDTVNEMRKKQNEEEFKNAKELFESQTAFEMAMTQAESMINEFVQRFNLTPEEMYRRRIDLNKTITTMPTATDNSQRSTFPVWKYLNVGVMTYHVNVPTMADVYGALLLSPYRLAKGFLLLQDQCSGDTDNLQNALADFFENGVSDSCFNAKWKAIEAFVEERQSIGTVSDVLNKLQADNQADFVKLGDDPDGAKELELMLKLAQGATGTDAASKRSRLITPDDVKAWHAKVMSASA